MSGRTSWKTSQVICIILSFLIAFTSLSSYPMVAQAAASTVTLSDLNSGNTVNFAGATWIVLEPNEGYLLMEDSYGSNKKFDSSYSPFMPTIETNIAYYLNHTFLGSLSAAEQAMIQTHSWTNGGQSYEDAGSVDCKVGLLAYSEYKAYTVSGTDNSIISDMTVGWWIRTNYQGNNGNFYVDPSGEGVFGDRVTGTACNSEHAVRPAIYLDPDTFVSGGNGGDVLLDAESSISNVTLDCLSNEVGINATVVVSVSTGNVPNGKDVIVSLVDNNKDSLTPTVTVTGEISDNSVELILNLPNTLSVGNYYVQVEVEGMTKKEYKPYIINHHAPDMSLTPTSHNENTPQDVTVSVTANEIPDGTTLYITLVDNNKNDIADVGTFQEIVSENAVCYLLFLPQTLEAGNYFVKVSGEGIETAYSPYEIKLAAPVVTLNPTTHNFGDVQSVVVSIATNNTLDGTNVTATLMETASNLTVAEVNPVNGTIQSNTATLNLVIPATLAAGNYYVQVEVTGLTEKAIALYNILTSSPLQCTISLSANPSDGGTTTGGGTFNIGTELTVTAVPNSNYNFINWTQDSKEVSNSAYYSFTCLSTADISLVANFQRKPKPTKPKPDIYKPKVATDSATIIEGDRAILNGHIIESVGADCTNANFQYRLKGEGGWKETPVKKVSLSKGDDFSAQLKNLKPNAEYEFKARASNKEGWGTGETRSFRIFGVPQVITDKAEDVDRDSAVLKGLITDDGGDSVIESGFMFGTSPKKLTQIKVRASSQGALYHRLTHLNLDTQYFYKAYVTTSMGTVYGDIQSFQTARFLVMTNEAANIGLSNATLSGKAYITMGDNTTITGCGFLYGTGPDLDKYTRVNAETLPDYNQKFFLTLTDLEPGTDYYYQAIAWNAIGESYGPIVSFKTLTHLPVVETLSPSTLLWDSATLSGYVTKNNGLPITQSGIMWGTNPEPENQMLLPLQSDKRSFSFSLTGLLPLTQYYAKAYAVNSAGTGYGETISFTTSATLPVVTTKEVIFVQEAWSARLIGSIDDNGGTSLSEYGFRYSTDQEEWLALSMGEDHEGEYASDSMYSLNNLQPGLTYYVQAYAANSAGTSYGETHEFTTITLPKVTASIDLEGIKVDTVILSGEIIESGMPDTVCTLRQFRYREKSNELWLEVGIEEGSFVPGLFSFNLTDLKPGNTYEFQAQAKNFAGWAESQLLEFTTTWGEDDKQAAANMKAAGYTSVQIANILKSDYENTTTATLEALQFAGFQLLDIANALRYSNYNATAAQIAGSYLENGLDITLALEMTKQYFYNERLRSNYDYWQIKALVQGGYSYNAVTEILKTHMKITSYEMALGYLFSVAHGADNYSMRYEPTQLVPEVEGVLLKSVAQIYGGENLRRYLWLGFSTESAVYALKLLEDGPYEIASIVNTLGIRRVHNVYIRACTYVLLGIAGFELAETADALVRIFGSDPGTIFHSLLYDRSYQRREGYPAPLPDIVKYLVEDLQVDLPRMATILTQNRSDLYRFYKNFNELNALQLLHQQYDPTALELARSLYTAGWTNPSVQSQDGYNLQSLADGLKAIYPDMTDRQMLGILKQVGIPSIDLAEIMTRTWQGIAWVDYCPEEGYTTLDMAVFYNAYLEANSQDTEAAHISFTITNLVRHKYDLGDIVLAVKTVYEPDQQEALLYFTQMDNMPWTALEIAEAVAKIYGGNLDFIRIMVEQMKMKLASPDQIVSTLRHTFKIEDPIELAGYLYPPQPGYTEEEVLKAIIRSFVQPYSFGDALKLALSMADEVYGINEVNLMILQAAYLAPPSSFWGQNPDVNQAVHMLQGAGFTLEQIVQVLKKPLGDGYNLTAMQVMDLLNLGTYSNVGTQALSFMDGKYNYGYDPAEVVAVVTQAFGEDLVTLKVKAIQGNSKSYTVPNWFLSLKLATDPRYHYAAYLALGTMDQDFGITDPEKAALYLHEAGFSEQEIFAAMNIYYEIPQMELLNLLLQKVFKANNYDTFALKFRELMGSEGWKFVKLAAEALQKAFPQINTSQIALTLDKNGYHEGEIINWLMHHTPQVKDSTLAAVLGSAQVGDLDLECVSATRILWNRGYTLEEAAQWLISNKYNLNQLFKELVDNYDVHPVQVISILNIHYDLEQLTTACNYYSQNHFYSTYSYLVDSGFSRDSVVLVMVKTTKKSAAELLKIIYWHNRNKADEPKSTIKRLSLTEICLVIYRVGLKNLELDMRLQDIVQGLLNDFPLDWAYTATKDLTAQYLRDNPRLDDNETPNLDHLALYILREAGLSSDDAAQIQVNRGVGLSAGSIIKSYIGVGNDWKEAMTNLAEAGYSFGDSFSAIWDNEVYHFIIGASILSQMATKAITSLTESQRVIDGIKYAKKIAKYGFKIGEALF